jgi:hypothetical protein
MIDSIKEEEKLEALRDAFTKEGDLARSQFVDHIIKGDWSLDKTQAKGEELGISVTTGFANTFEKPIANMSD